MIVYGKGNWRGTGIVHRFANGYGASVITDGYGSDDGLLELAVIKWDGDNYSLTYETPITDDVCGYLAGEEVEALLARIEALNPADIVAEKVSRKRAEIERLRSEISSIEDQIAALEELG